MAVSNYSDPHGPVFRRPIRVRWAGFTGDTFEMQRDGWQFAVERYHNMRDLYRDAYIVLARHKRHGWTMRGSMVGFRLEGRDPFDDAEIVIEHCSPGDVGLLAEQPIAMKFKRVNVGDYESMYTPIARQSIARSGLFPEWLEPERKEIITRPDEVADLLEKISKLQEPEMLAIRERNRLRDVRDRAPEITHASIISIAA